MRILGRKEIHALLPGVSLLEPIEEGFVKYSRGLSVVPPVGELTFDAPPGDVHIKYGYLQGDDYYVIKVASGFYENPRLGIASSDGLMLLFGRRTGELQAILLDQGLLTDIRTAVAGAIAARHVAPKKIERIGIVGTGIQAKLQLQYLSLVTDCRDVSVWGRNARHAEDYRLEMSRHGFAVSVVAAAADLLHDCNLIVTTTPAREPVLDCADDLPHGLHATAVGSDSHDKREIGPNLFRRADVVVADSISQCLLHGELHHAVAEGLVRRDSIVELGSVIAGDMPGRESDDEVTIADLTGVAVQDIQIAKAVYRAAESSPPAGDRGCESPVPG